MKLPDRERLQELLAKLAGPAIIRVAAAIETELTRGNARVADASVRLARQLKEYRSGCSR